MVLGLFEPLPILKVPAAGALNWGANPPDGALDPNVAGAFVPKVGAAVAPKLNPPGFGGSVFPPKLNAAGFVLLAAAPNENPELL